MNDDRMQVGQGSSGGQLQPAATAPVPPSMAERMCNVEQRNENQLERITTLERVVGNLVTENAALRADLGLQPLPPDYFS